MEPVAETFLLHHLYSHPLAQGHGPSKAIICGPCVGCFSHKRNPAGPVLLILTGSGRGPCSCTQIIHQQFSFVHAGYLQVGKDALQTLKLCSFAPAEGLAHSNVQESNIQYN